ncbi:MAG: hypothetical protein WDZ41_04885 [Candidatus Babeliales bacterium]
MKNKLLLCIAIYNLLTFNMYTQVPPVYEADVAMETKLLNVTATNKTDYDIEIIVFYQKRCDDAGYVPAGQMTYTIAPHQSNDAILIRNGIWNQCNWKSNLQVTFSENGQPAKVITKDNVESFNFILLPSFEITKDFKMPEILQ